MATISHNDHAPDSAEVTYSLGSAEPFTLKGDASYEVVEPEAEAGEERAAYDSLLANARTHPWLKVEVPEPTDDEDGPVEVAVEYPKTAIDAALDQNVAEYEGEGSLTPIAETLQADEDQGDEPIVVDDPADDPIFNDEPVEPVED